MTQPNRESRPDPLIDEIRAIRRAISEEDGNDLKVHVERLREIERQYAQRVVHPPLPAKPPETR
jgi:hypothetical protein